VTQRQCVAFYLHRYYDARYLSGFLSASKRERMPRLYRFLYHPGICEYDADRVEFFSRASYAVRFLRQSRHDCNHFMGSGPRRRLL
jgi:hypothetical protein